MHKARQLLIVTAACAGLLMLAPAVAQAEVAPDEQPGKPLSFMLTIGLNAVINHQNATCFSNVLTVPGPPGWRIDKAWGGPGRARPLIEPYYADFVAKCGAIAPVRGVPNIVWNDKGLEDRPEKGHQDLRRRGQAEVRIGG